ncbi:LysR family transcriptional regulator [Nonomuraea sp. NPDC046802]|uniref:LysR family transcriptional regulator n=1 Tax=Nonomuraea sp. NPDC046802 TaxID=3154919 RepID=UPI0033E580C4
MELRHFRYFVAVAEEGSFTRAAVRLHVSQPTLSQQVRELEQRVGATLLVRDPAGTRLTAAGEAFYDRIKTVLNAVEEAARTARHVARAGEGTLRVGVSLPLPDELHFSVLSAFAAAYPRVRTSWRQVGLTDFDRPLIDGELDAAIMFMPVDSERLTWEPLTTVPRALAVPIGHPFWDAASVPYTEVLAEPLVRVASAVPERVTRWWHLHEQRNGEGPRLFGEPGGTPDELLIAVRMHRVLCPGPYNYKDTPLPSGIRMVEVTGLSPATVVAVRRVHDSGGLAEAFCRLPRAPPGRSRSCADRRGQ